ncbi:MAG: arylsulfatase [bacterium]|nr:arylsulfatase [bacterium]
MLGCATDAHSGASKKATARKPNIIFIMVDDLGYGDLGCYGQKVIKTPNIDNMAEQGIRFTQCYAGSTVCAPSRCCLMTGLHTGHAYVRGNARVPLRPEDVTVAEVLKEAGYTTGLVGKWGLGEPDTSGIPNRQGFDYFFGYLNQGNAHNYYPEFLWRNEKKVPLEGNVESDKHKRVSVKRAQYSHDLFAEEALQFLDRSKDDPFFLYYALTIPHANNERGRADGDGMEVPDYGIYKDRDWPNPQKGHAAMITRMDADIGRLFDKLRDLGLDDNTIVFFTSDNGPHKEGGADPAFFTSWGPLRGYKRDLYEGGIRVPGIVRWPGHVAEGEVSDHIWTFWDFLPTAAELTGAECPKNLDGVSFAPTLLGKETTVRTRFLYWEFHEGKSSKQAVRAGRWKGVRLDPNGPLELYDLRTDIGEQTNVAEKNPEIVNKMQDFLAKSHTDSEHFKMRSAKK